MEYKNNFVEKLEKEKLIDFAEQFEEMKNLRIIGCCSEEMLMSL